MAVLAQDQLQFLTSQRIPTSMLFDATGMRKRDYALAMAEIGAYFAFGVAPRGRPSTEDQGWSLHPMRYLEDRVRPSSQHEGIGVRCLFRNGPLGEGRSGW